MPRGESMSFSPEEKVPSPERGLEEFIINDLTDLMATAQEKVKGAKTPEEVLNAILVMEKIQPRLEQAKTNARWLTVVESSEGVEAGFKEQFLEFAKKRDENAEAIKEVRGNIKKVTADLKAAEAKLEGADRPEAILKEISNVDGIQAKLSSLEAEVRRLALENLALASSLSTMKEKKLSGEKPAFTTAEEKWFGKGKKMSDFWEAEAAEREAIVDQLEEEFMAEAA
ncbi:hypothetical protein HZB93_03120 [Candidatus Falkowbacteria bacterium]|nr:hypothetical protein [Candidatus Falkowbacteria bacterium]